MSEAYDAATEICSSLAELRSQLEVLNEWLEDLCAVQTTIARTLITGQTEICKALDPKKTYEVNLDLIHALQAIDLATLSHGDAAIREMQRIARDAIAKHGSQN